MHLVRVCDSWTNRSKALSGLCLRLEQPCERSLCDWSSRITAESGMQCNGGSAASDVCTGRILHAGPTPVPLLVGAVVTAISHLFYCILFFFFILR